MSSTANQNKLKFIGLLIIIYWLSLCIYLPPIAPTPKIDAILGELQTAKETLGPAYPAKLDQPREVLKGRLVRETNLFYASYVVPIIIGIFSGVLIYLRKRLGQIIALGLSLISIFLIVKGIFSTYPYILEAFKLKLKFFPAKTLHEQIFGLLFYVATLVMLTRPHISKQFNKTT